MDNNDIVKIVNRLIETCKDGEFGFRTSAEHVRNADLRLLLNNRANDCQQAAGELQDVVSDLGGSAEHGGSASGAAHRGWVSMKGTLAGYTDQAMLEECERGEDVAMDRYRKALDEALPPTVRAIVEQQYEGVKRNHAQVRALRNQARATHS